jgi:hypothetical protein
VVGKKSEKKFNDQPLLRRASVIIQTITRIGQRSKFIAFLQVKATGFNFSNHR